MKTAGMVLGIVGSVLCVLMALLFVFAGLLYSTPGIMSLMDSYSQGFGQAAVTLMIAFILIFALILLVCCILGIVGAVKIRKKGHVAGIVMVIAAVLSAMTIYGILSAIFFVIGGIFAFIEDKKDALAAVQCAELPQAPQTEA